MTRNERQEEEEEVKGAVKVDEGEEITIWSSRMPCLTVVHIFSEKRGIMPHLVNLNIFSALIMLKFYDMKLHIL